MEQPKASDFRADPAPGGPSMAEAVAQARRAITAMNGCKVDAVSRCVRDEAGDWRVTVEVVESAARMGDNDLLCAYEVVIARSGDVSGFTRIGRYHREDVNAP